MVLGPLLRDSVIVDLSELGQNLSIYNALTCTFTASCYRKEGNVLFNDALNTFYLRLHGVRHMVKDHSDSERGNSLPPHRLLFPISSKSYFIYIIPQTGMTHTTAFVTPIVEHWLEREISCYSARLSWALVLTWVSPFVQDKKVGFGLGEE